MNEAKKNLVDALASGNKAAIEAAKRGLIQQYRNDNVLICLLNQAKKPRKRILQAKESRLSPSRMSRKHLANTTQCIKLRFGSMKNR